MATTVRWITFDCYGTLVDFGIDPVIVDLLGPRARDLDLDHFLMTAMKIRYQEAVLGEYRPYRELLRRSLARVMRQFGLPYRDADGDAIVAAVSTFGPFPEVPAVLETLRRHFKLAIISNTDDDLIAGNLERIGVPFDQVVTAEQARCYKPNLGIFHYALQRLGCKPSEVVHVAQGFDYDIWPAHYLGWTRVWINRSGRAGDPAFGPYHELPDMTGLPALLGIEGA